MLELALGRGGAPVRSILCLGAHCDDIEIGCGGTVMSLAERFESLACHWVVLSSDPVRGTEARRSADAFLAGVATKNVVMKQFRDGFFPYVAAEIKEFFEVLKHDVAPDLVFTHYRDDAHQDHRLTRELTLNTFRDHLVLEYEVPKYDGDLGSPNVFVPLSEAQCREKARIITQSFESQKDRRWFTEDTFLAIARLRGIECRAAGGYAEAFYARKLRLTT